MYDSISEASRKENIERRSIQFCLSGNARYSIVKNRIWRYFENNTIVENSLKIKTVLSKYNTYICAKNLNTNEVIKFKTFAELGNFLNLKASNVRYYVLKNRIKNNYLFYKEVM